MRLVWATELSPECEPQVYGSSIMNPMDASHPMFRVDKTAFSVASLSDETDEKAYWRSKTAYERLQAVELMRQVIYGYKLPAARLQRVFETAELKAG